MVIANRIGFRGRLISSMVALVAVVSVSIGALMMLYLFEDEKARAMEQLSLGERVAEEILERRTSLILSRLDVVVRDFGFRSAMASRDRATARRVGARFAMIIGEDNELLASTGNPPGDLEDRVNSLGLLSKSRSDGFASQVTVMDNQAIELVTIGVVAPGLRAQLIAGFELGSEVADIIERLSGTEALYRARTGSKSTFRFLSDDAKINRSRLEKLVNLTSGNDGSGNQLAGDEQNSTGFVISDHYFSRMITLADEADTDLQMVLLINRAASLNAYYQRAIEILLLVSSVLVLAALIALIVARSLGQPVLSLARYAKAIGDGEAPEPPPVKVGGELAQLRSALGDMLAKLKNREEQIRYAASHDEITGLPNAHAFLNRVRESFRNGQAYRLFGIQH